MKKILFISHYPTLYGANLSLLNLIQGLKNEANIEIIVITTHTGDFSSAMINLGVKFYIVLMDFDMVKTIPSGIINKILFQKNHFIKQLSSLRKIINIVKTEKITSIYTNSSVNYFGILTSLWLKKNTIGIFENLLQFIIIYIPSMVKIFIVFY